MKKGILFALLIFLGCSKQTPPQSEVILARVGAKSISVNEFIERSEYTIRPAWCKNDDYISKKIVLNSLIAEKLLAIEAGEDSVLLGNPEVEDYLTGRREQSMRRLYQYKHGVAKVKRDTQFTHKVSALAQRKYLINILGASSQKQASEIVDFLHKPSSLLSLSLQQNDSLKAINVTFQTPLPDEIVKALYFKEHKKGAIIGPIKLDGQQFAVLKVGGWTRPLMASEQKSRQILNDVQKRINEIEGMDIYGLKIAELMNGKNVQFNKAVFKSIVTAIAPYYFQTAKQRKAVFNKKFWNKDNSKMTIDDLSGMFDRLANDTFFSFSGKSWTVAAFEQEIRRHPLIFRDRKMSRARFANQFKLAVVDMLRDRVITNQAYAEGLDEDQRVVRDEGIWRDNMLALHQREELLMNLPNAPKNAFDQVKLIFDDHVDVLRKKYAKQIFINTTEFEKIKLTAIDMFAIRQREAFPVVVPEFPVLTTHNQLDYGQRMDIKK